MVHMVPRAVPRSDWRVNLGIAVQGALVCLALIGWFVSSLAKDREEMRAARAENLAMWAGAELVRICARGERIYRLNGRLVTGAPVWSQPQQFAADVTPEAACVR